MQKIRQVIFINIYLTLTSNDFCAEEEEEEADNFVKEILF